MKIFYLLISLTVIGCFSTKIIPIKGSYSDGNFEGYSEKNKDVVWDNIIDFFAKSGIPIKIIDRSSGLITSGEAPITITRENSKGQLINPGAWVVIQTTIDPGTKRVIKYDAVTAEWNIRIKETNNKTLINVNLVNPTFSSLGQEKKFFKKGEFQSTGVFEKTIYEIVK